MALADWVSLVGFIAAFLSFMLGGINLWYTREKTKVRGPKINIPYVEFDEIKEKRSETGVTINFLFQNVGDRMTFLIIKRITIKKQVLENSESPLILKPTIEDDGLMLSPQSQTIKEFAIKVPFSREEIVNSILSIHTIYTDHIGNLLEKGWRFKITQDLIGELISIWKNQRVVQVQQKRFNFAKRKIERTEFKAE
jgi:hypothetical protein